MKTLTHRLVEALRETIELCHHLLSKQPSKIIDNARALLVEVERGEVAQTRDESINVDLSGKLMNICTKCKKEFLTDTIGGEEIDPQSGSGVGEECRGYLHFLPTGERPCVCGILQSESSPPAQQHTEWQKKFLDFCTENGLGDCSIAIRCVSEIITAQQPVMEEDNCYACEYWERHAMGHPCSTEHEKTHPKHTCKPTQQPAGNGGVPTIHSVNHDGSMEVSFPHKPVAEKAEGWEERLGSIILSFPLYTDIEDAKKSTEIHFEILDLFQSALAAKEKEVEGKWREKILFVFSQPDEVILAAHKILHPDEE